MNLAQQQTQPSATNLPPGAFVLAIDGGGSKTDAVALSVEGELLASGRSTGSNHQVLGLEHALSVIDDLATQVHGAVGHRPLVQTSLYLSGMDLPSEIEMFSEAIAGRSWIPQSGNQMPLVDNDLFALLRAGTNQPDAVVVVCGTGINAAGVRADGATARFPALGAISGDSGGGGYLGSRALWHAARSEDGRGPKTLLEVTVPQAFGLSSVMALTEAIHFKRLPARSLVNLCPVLFETSRAGDQVAAAEVDHQAHEIVLMAVTALRRLHLENASVPVVLGGGVLAAGDARLMAGVERGLRELAPHAYMQLVTSPPILGAGMLALEAAGAAGPILDKARTAIENLAPVQ
ncbi:BadF/BadG/BcrA/BcrD ATPase family protein [Paenarthrobacter sp. GOM3]|uniref:N-acetylglucosamine kinase n=1 Tax=Paenarthrobacter sp. GOM3 TaxID=2782567 RepID=UPI001BA4CE4A|nr:BadF/BadG/BcrA/BcrD ATPase family protein [Paenarthrobacter sp. GOM3]WOH20710.1 BadF/BadG/BcrA/BcrD ATPase family protein [Paenarthrobacter sp. GOM3]